MKKIAILLFYAVAFMFIAAPIYMNKEASHALTINGKSFGNAVSINGVLAISVEDFSRAVGGGPANIQVQGNKLSIGPAVQASSAAGSSFTTAHGSGGGGGAGKVRFHDISITKHVDSASPLLYREGKPFVRLDDVAKFFGGTFTAPATLTNGAPINLNFAPNPNAALTLTHTP